jgi:hypothetical protein
MTARGEEPITRNTEDALLGDVSKLIEHARTRSAAAVNSELVMLYWGVGRRVRDEVVGRERAVYGQAVVKRLAMRLAEQYGRGWSKSNLLRMIQFADDFTDGSIVVTLSRQLSWSHFVEIVALRDAGEREFYATHAARERWSVRTLRERIASQLYARTLGTERSDDAPEVSSASPEETADEKGILFRDPYVLDFLGLPTKLDLRRRLDVVEL